MVGTVTQLHKATAIPRSTITLYARQGHLQPVDRVLVGRCWAVRYDAAQLLAIYATRLPTRRNQRVA